MSEHIAINGRANKTKSTFRMEYSAGINIKAKPDRVWALMLPMIAGSLPDFGPAFEKYVTDLKKESEKK